MTRRRPSFFWSGLWIEYLFAAIVAGFLIYTAWFLKTYRYLPQPFFYEPSGVFMDWYSLSPYAHFPGAYDIEQTIYPPLSFVVMKIFGNWRCYVANSLEDARYCDHVGMVALFGMFFINIVLTFLTFYKHERRTFFPRAFALSCGLPMVYGLERGNLLIFCYAAILLAFGPLLRSARWRWFFGGVALNFKIYLVGAVVAPLLRRRWLPVEGMLVATMLIYVVTWLILGEGSPAQIFRNVFSFATNRGASGVLDMWYSSSFIPHLALLRGQSFPITGLIDSRVSDYGILALVSYTRLTQGMIILAAVATWLRPEVVPTYRMVYFAIAMALSASEAGGYTELLLLFFIFMEAWRGIGRRIAIFLAYLLTIPADIVVIQVPNTVHWSFLTGTDVIAAYGVGVGAFLRPIISMGITLCLTSVTLRDVWHDIHEQGWRSRRRFRHDMPLLTGPRAAGQAA